MYRIKEIMNQKGINSKELAELLDVTPQYISNILREKDNISVKTLCRIADTLDVPVSSLFEDYAIQLGDGMSIRCPHCHKNIRMKVVKD